jgi:hypothetical protein
MDLQQAHSVQSMRCGLSNMAPIPFGRKARHSNEHEIRQAHLSITPLTIAISIPYIDLQLDTIDYKTMTKDMDAHPRPSREEIQRLKDFPAQMRVYHLAVALGKPYSHSE